MKRPLILALLGAYLLAMTAGCAIVSTETSNVGGARTKRVKIFGIVTIWKSEEITDKPGGPK